MQKIIISKADTIDKIVVSGSEVAGEDTVIDGSPPIVLSSSPELERGNRKMSLFWWVPLSPFLILYGLLAGRQLNRFPWFIAQPGRRQALWACLLAAFFWGFVGMMLVGAWSYRIQARKSESISTANHRSLPPNSAPNPKDSNALPPGPTGSSPAGPATQNLSKDQRPSPPTPSLKELFADYKYRVFVIQKHGGQGSGVLLYGDQEGRLIATARHVVELQDSRGNRKVLPEVWVTPFEGSVLRARVVGWHQQQDLALIWLPGGQEPASFYHPIVESGRVEIAEPVWTIGHPLGQTFSLSDGKINRLPQNGLLQFNAPISSGNSGGPLYDLKGNLLGIVSFARGPGRGDVAQNLNFAVCADAFLSTTGWQLEPIGAAKLAEFSNRRRRNRGSIRHKRRTEKPTPLTNNLCQAST